MMQEFEVIVRTNESPANLNKRIADAIKPLEGVTLVTIEPLANFESLSGPSDKHLVHSCSGCAPIDHDVSPGVSDEI